MYQRIPETLVKEIREYYDQNKDYISIISVSIKYNIKSSTIRRILIGQSYKDAGGPIQEKIIVRNNVYYQYTGKLIGKIISTGEKIVFNNIADAAKYVIDNKYSNRDFNYVKHNIQQTLLCNGCRRFNIIWTHDNTGKFILSDHFFTRKEIEEIRDKYFNKKILAVELMKTYNISSSHIYNILHGKLRKQSDGKTQSIFCELKNRNSYKHIWKNKIMRINPKTGEEKVFTNLKEAVSDLIQLNQYDQEKYNQYKSSIQGAIHGYTLTAYGYIWKSLI